MVFIKVLCFLVISYSSLKTFYFFKIFCTLSFPKCSEVHNECILKLFPFIVRNRPLSFVDVCTFIVCVGFVDQFRKSQARVTVSSTKEDPNSSWFYIWVVSKSVQMTPRKSGWKEKRWRTKRKNKRCMDLNQTHWCIQSTFIS